ncbi:MAG: histidine kinase dimerization/phospho-acceptor domain-containing protein, partial [Pseudomonadota bacterium]
MMQDKHPLAASPTTEGIQQSPATWEYFNLGMGLLTRDMELLSYNSALCNLCGLAPESMMRSNLYGILGIKASSIGAIRSMLESDGNWSGKIRLGDRSLRIDLASLSPNTTLSDDPLQPVYSVSILDYSEEFRQLQLMSEAKFQAEKTDRAKSQFLSHMSHELRTPLNAILGFAQLLGMDETLTELQMDNVREIEGAGEYLLSLINEILDLSRIEAGRIELSEDV